MKKFSFLFLTIAALTLVCCKKASEETVDPVVSDNPGIASAEDFMAFAAAVNAGEWVDAGVLLGTVGTSALCEVAQASHLHFELRLNGACVDPTVYLSA